MIRPRATATDSFRLSLVVLVAVGAAGMVSILAASTRIAGLDQVDHRALPYVASGGLAGFVAVGAAIALVALQAQRRRRADRRALVGDVALEAAGLRDALVRRRGSAAS